MSHGPKTNTNGGNICIFTMKLRLERYIKRYSNPFTGLDRPLVFQEVEAPRLPDNDT
jgi:hypothetical protein